jgi:hypothetical protein
VPYLPDAPGNDSDRPHRMIIDSALDQFTTSRATELLLLKSADESVWRKMATHPEYDQ